MQSVQLQKVTPAVKRLEIVIFPAHSEYLTLDMSRSYTLEKTTNGVNRSYRGCRPFHRNGTIVFDLNQADHIVEIK